MPPVYNTVSVNGQNIFGNSNGEVVTVTLSPLAKFFDVGNNLEINPQPIVVTSDNTGAWTLSGIIDPTTFTTNIGLPWSLTVVDKASQVILYQENVLVAYAQGATQHWLNLTAPPPQASITSFTGPPGPQGPPGIGINWRGIYSNTTQYGNDDAVQYAGSSFVCTGSALGVVPGNPTSPTPPWTLLAEIGGTGATGLQGPTGPQGPAGLNWRGSYSNSTTYNANDAVQYSGSAFVAGSTTTGTAPGSPGSPNAPWTLLAEEGATGPSGGGTTLSVTSVINGGSFSASANNLCLVNLSTNNSGGDTTINLPATPSMGTTIGVQIVELGYNSGSTRPYQVTIVAQGTDKINAYDSSGHGGVQQQIFGGPLDTIWVYQYDSNLLSWLSVNVSLQLQQLDNRYQNVVNVQSAPFNAVPDGSTNNQTAIQNAINYAAIVGAPCYIPAANNTYVVSGLSLPAGSVLAGYSSSSYGLTSGENLDQPGFPCSILKRASGSTSHVIVCPDGSNFQRIQDIGIDGSKTIAGTITNPETACGIAIADGAQDQEGQQLIQRCFIFNSAGSGIYLGHNRRAPKVQYCISNYAGGVSPNASVIADGITVATSDATIFSCILGSNTRAGICLGTTTGPYWSADSGNTAAAVIHVISNDIYGGSNTSQTQIVGIAVCSGTWGCVLMNNGIDRHLKEGVYLVSGASTVLSGNIFHSNGLASASATYGHIGVGSSVTSASIVGNSFGPLDGSLDNPGPLYCVIANGSASSQNIVGDLGTADPTSALHGLIQAKPGVWSIQDGAYNGGNWTPSDQGLVTWSEDPMMCDNNSPPAAAGTIYLRRVHIATACTITNVVCAVPLSAGSSLTNCYGALYDTSGNRLAVSTDQASLFTSTGVKSIPLSSTYSLTTAGDYYIALLFNDSSGTLPSLMRSNNASSSVVNIGLSSGSSRVAKASATGNSTMPSSITIIADNNSFWMGLS